MLKLEKHILHHFTAAAPGFPFAASLRDPGLMPVTWQPSAR